MAEVTSVHAVAPGDSSGSAAGAFATLREGVPLSHSLLINSLTLIHHYSLTTEREIRALLKNGTIFLLVFLFLLVSEES